VCKEFPRVPASPGAAFEEVGEEIGVVRGQGAELVRRVCLASSSWLSAQRGSRYMKPPGGHGPGATSMKIAVMRTV
jgi:hypothetical protein